MRAAVTFMISHPPFPVERGRADEPPSSQSVAAGALLLRFCSQEIVYASRAALVVTFGSQPLSDEETGAWMSLTTVLVICSSKLACFASLHLNMSMGSCFSCMM